MLKATDVKLELIYDVCMHLMVQNGMKGGVSYIAHRYDRASIVHVNESGKNDYCN